MILKSRKVLIVVILVLVAFTAILLGLKVHGEVPVSTQSVWHNIYLHDIRKEDGKFTVGYVDQERYWDSWKKDPLNVDPRVFSGINTKHLPLATDAKVLINGQVGIDGADEYGSRSWSIEEFVNATGTLVDSVYGGPLRMEVRDGVVVVLLLSSAG